MLFKVSVWQSLNAKAISTNSQLLYSMSFSLKTKKGRQKQEGGRKKAEGQKRQREKATDEKKPAFYMSSCFWSCSCSCSCSCSGSFLARVLTRTLVLVLILSLFFLCFSPSPFFPQLSTSSFCDLSPSWFYCSSLSRDASDATWIF